MAQSVASGRGRPKKGQISQAEKKRRAEELANEPPRRCPRCGEEFNVTELYVSNTIVYPSRVPLCKNCIEECYDEYVNKYKAMERKRPERDAVRRLCMILDMYFSDEVYDKAVKNYDAMSSSLPIFLYLKMVRLAPHNKKSYDDTIAEELSMGLSDTPEDTYEVDAATIKFFGKGFSQEDYVFLKEQYDEWTSRHECQTKAQEEIFKDICFNRLQNWKARQKGEDTKGITDAFNKLLESGKLQPKQNASETTADNQSFGTLIQKWEMTRPIPDVDEDMKDVDRIGLYMDVFYKGHMAKMLKLGNDTAAVYDRYIKKYSASKPDYDTDDDTDAIFDKIFGKELEKEVGS